MYTSCIKVGWPGQKTDPGSVLKNIMAYARETSALALSGPSQRL